MEIIVHGIDMELKEDYKNVGEVIDHISSRGFVIRQIIVDGKEIETISEEEILKSEGIGCLEIVGQSVKELICESIEESEAYIPRLISGIDEIIDNFSRDQKEEGYNSLAQALEGMQWLNSLLDTLESKADSYGYDKKSLKEFIIKWKGIFEEFLTAMENQDFILINDILEYELSPLFKEYLELMEEVKASL